MRGCSCSAGRDPKPCASLEQAVRRGPKRTGARTFAQIRAVWERPRLSRWPCRRLGVPASVAPTPAGPVCHAHGRPRGSDSRRLPLVPRLCLGTRGNSDILECGGLPPLWPRRTGRTPSHPLSQPTVIGKAKAAGWHAVTLRSGGSACWTPALPRFIPIVCRRCAGRRSGDRPRVPVSTPKGNSRLVGVTACPAMRTP